nr:MAG TPA: hypothetical protein [Caudoviricetes sp.]
MWTAACEPKTQRRKRLHAGRYGKHRCNVRHDFSAAANAAPPANRQHQADQTMSVRRSPTNESKGESEMSINIPAETPDESMNPISVEEFERLHPAMLGAIRKAVREELKLSHADGRTSADVQRTFDLQLFVPDVPLVFGDALHGISQRNDGLLNVSGLRVGLRVISGIHWIALHIITSLLCAGLLILPLGRKALKRERIEKAAGAR